MLIHKLGKAAARCALMTGAVTLSAVSAGAQDEPDMHLTPEQISSDIALAEKAYMRIHPGYTRYASDADLAQAWDDLEARATQSGGLSLSDFYLGIQSVLATIRCDHTKAELPKVLVEIRKQTPAYLPFRWSVIDDRGFIRVPQPKSELSYGDEILSIDDKPLSDMIDRVAPLIPVDGYTEWSRRAGISESLEFRGGAIDHFGALIWDIRPKAEIEIRKPNGIRRTISVDRVTFEDWSTLGAEDGVTGNFKDAVTFARLGENAGYLKIDTFVNYRDYADPDDIYNPVFDTIQSENLTHLILDLRENGGGSGDALSGLMERLVLEKKDFYRDVQVKSLELGDLKEHLWTWEKAALKPNKLAFKKNDDGTYSFRKFAGQHSKIKPKKNTFTGKLVVLMSDANSSASTSILSHLKDSGRATLIGQKTGGSSEGPTAGVLFTLTLPESKIKTRIPAIRYFHDVDSFDPGLGVTPDVEIAITVNDFLAGRDPALEKAKSIIGD